MNENVKKLDSALADWEKVSAILSDSALVRAIGCIRDREVGKTAGECDFGLIEEATEELLILNGEDPDEVREYAQRRAEENLKSFTEASSRTASAGRRVAGRILPVAAAVAAVLIAAVVLMIFGTGSIRGFAYTLLLGVIVSMFTAILVTRFLMNRFVDAGCTEIRLFAKVKAEEEVAQ